MKQHLKSNIQFDNYMHYLDIFEVPNLNIHVIDLFTYFSLVYITVRSTVLLAHILRLQDHVIVFFMIDK